MQWYWYVFVTLQVVADLFFFVGIAMLMFAHYTIDKNTKAVAKATMGLYKVFGLDVILSQPPPAEPTKQPDTKLN